MPLRNESCSCRTVKLRTPNIKWHITLSGPRTRTVRPPWLSFNPPLTRSAALRRRNELVPPCDTRHGVAHHSSASSCFSPGVRGLMSR